VGAAGSPDANEVGVIVVDQAVAVVVLAVAHLGARDALRAPQREILVDQPVAVVIDAIAHLDAWRQRRERRAGGAAVVDTALPAAGAALADAGVSAHAGAHRAGRPAEVVGGAGVTTRALTICRASAAPGIAVVAAAVGVGRTLLIDIAPVVDAAIAVV